MLPGWTPSAGKKKSATTATVTKRQKRCKPWQQDPASVQDCHLAFVENAYKHSGTKVVILFGKDNREGYQPQWAGKLDKIRLWGDNFQGVEIWVVYTTPERTAIERLVMPTMHPEGLTRSRSIDRAAEADSTYLAGSIMCRIVRPEAAVVMQRHLASEQEHRPAQRPSNRRAKGRIRGPRQAGTKERIEQTLSGQARISPCPGTSQWRSIAANAAICRSMKHRVSGATIPSSTRWRGSGSAPKCTERATDAASKGVARPFIPVNRLVPWMYRTEGEWKHTPKVKMELLNIVRQTQQKGGISLEGRPFIFSVPPGSGDDYDGPVTITGLRDDAGDPNIAKSKNSKGLNGKTGKRYTNQGRHDVHLQLYFAPAPLPISAAAAPGAHCPAPTQVCGRNPSRAIGCIHRPGEPRPSASDAHSRYRSRSCVRQVGTKVDDPGQSKISSFFGKPQNES
ncbi:hypothetical protein MCOR25_000003 [Pyricularia grisea]|nr:hypothetical protein MCOR25_000003 [Pyricularia grisea]